MTEAEQTGRPGRRYPINTTDTGPGLGGARPYAARRARDHIIAVVLANKMYGPHDAVLMACFVAAGTKSDVSAFQRTIMFQ